MSLSHYEAILLCDRPDCRETVRVEASEWQEYDEGGISYDPPEGWESRGHRHYCPEHFTAAYLKAKQAREGK